MASIGAVYMPCLHNFFIRNCQNPITKMYIKSVIKITHQIAKVRKQTRGWSGEFTLWYATHSDKI